LNDLVALEIFYLIDLLIVYEEVFGPDTFDLEKEFLLAKLISYY